MSFMPDEGTRVRLVDGQIAVVVKATPDGKDDRVRLDSGAERLVTAWDIAEVIEPKEEI